MVAAWAILQAACSGAKRVVETADQWADSWVCAKADLLAASSAALKAVL
jgi:hypothetical protein